MFEDLHAIAIDVPTASGALEGRLVHAGTSSPHAGVLLFPPHPLLAGNLDNNVVRHVCEGVAREGLPVLTFNYRAVGKSFRPHPEVPLYEYWSRLDERKDYAEVACDAGAAARYAQEVFGEVHVVAYSFGAFLASRCGSLLADARSWCLLAPPWGEEDFSAIERLQARCLCIEPEADGLVGAANCPSSFERLEVRGADHFFRGREGEVARAVARFLRQAQAYRGHSCVAFS